MLGPLLFSIFINDLPNEVHSHIKIFADDTKLYNSTGNFNLLSDDLNALVSWSNRWLLPFNVDKCKILHYGKHNEGYLYYMDGSVLSEDSSIKDLGVIFQDDLKFDEHISKICATANSRLGLIRNTFHSIDRDGFLVLYKCLVRPILEYCNLIWSPFLKKHHKMIEKVQRRATKMIKGFSTLSYSERLINLKLDTLYFRRRRADLLQVFRIISKIDCVSFDNFFKFDEGRTRGNCKKLFKPRAGTSTKQHCFSHRVINDWNMLPDYVVSSESLNSFKSNLKMCWRDKSFRYEYE